MNEEKNISQEQIDALYQKLNKDAQSGGYYLNPDIEFTKLLVRSLLINQNRFGYQACPCRLAANNKETDLDIICPCDYRDADVAEYGACYCGLYVSAKVASGEQKLKSIPERRPPPEKRLKSKSLSSEALAKGGAIGNLKSSLPLPVWRCKVCGYLCARDEPPDICPICKVKKDRFERFI